MSCRAPIISSPPYRWSFYKRGVFSLVSFLVLIAKASCDVASFTATATATATQPVTFKAQQPLFLQASHPLPVNKAEPFGRLHIKENIYSYLTLIHHAHLPIHERNYNCFFECGAVVEAKTFSTAVPGLSDSQFIMVIDSTN